MFNVINDKWIPTNDGLYGLRELVAKAHKLKEIRGENPMQEFAIKRLLFVFLIPTVLCF